MKDLWKHHVEYYDLFQMNRDSYVKTLNFFVKEFKNYNKILDSGAGSGNLTLELLKKKHEVFVIDANGASIEILKKKCNKFKLKLNSKVMDVQKINFSDDSFEGVASMFITPFVKNNKKYFSDVYRILKKKCKFIIASWAPVKDSWNGIMVAQEKELMKKGFLPKYKKEWNYIKKSARLASNEVLNAPNLYKIRKFLTEVGFKKIKNLKSPYGKYSYLLVCEK